MPNPQKIQLFANSAQIPARSTTLLLEHPRRLRYSNRMKHPLRIVCMGGGTGLPQLLSGFKLLAATPEGSDAVALEHLTAIVTAFDDGGSSGRIVEAYQTLPPGDLRNCLVALADERAEPLLTHFFNHRFREDEHESLAGHSAGNLLLLTLSQIHGGDLRKALLSMKAILPFRSTLLFPTLSPAVLCAELADGTVIRGESRIAQRDNRVPIIRVFLEHRQDGAPQGFPPMEGVLEAIAQADLITLGPGSLYTSVLPHFLVDGISEALRTCRAKKVYVCNLMIESGETDGFRVSDHVSQLEHLGRFQVDAVVANSAPVPEGMRRAYERARLQAELDKSQRALQRAFERSLALPESAHQLELEADLARAHCYELAELIRHPGSTFVQVLPHPGERFPARTQVITEDLLAHAEVVDRGNTKKVIRHDPIRLAQTILRALRETCP